MNWRSNSNLTHRRVVVTRSAAQAGPLAKALRARGAEVVLLPAIAIAPPPDWAAFDHALRAIASYAGFVFTSANAVASMMQRLQELGEVRQPPAGSWVAAIGPATATALPASWRANVVADQHHAAGLLAALAARDLRGKAIFLPQAAEASEEVAAGLRACGAAVTAVAAYATVLPEASRSRAQSLFPVSPEGRPAAIIFTSGSTVRNFTAMLGSEYRERLQGVTLTAIGPATRREIEALGLRVQVEAPAASVTALVDSLERFWNA